MPGVCPWVDDRSCPHAARRGGLLFLRLGCRPRFETPTRGYTWVDGGETIGNGFVSAEYMKQFQNSLL